MAKKLKTTETFVKELEERYGDIYDYSKVVYINKNVPVIVICKKHNYEFPKKPKDLLRMKVPCPKCSKSHQPTTEEFIEKAKSVHGDRYDYSKVAYEKNNKEVCII